MTEIKLPVDQETYRLFEFYCKSRQQKPEDVLTNLVLTHAHTGQWLENMEKNMQGALAGTLAGFLNTYTDMGMEGYEQVVLFEGKEGHLADMRCIFEGDHVKVFDKNNQIVLDKVVTDIEELRPFAEQSCLAHLQPLVERKVWE
jgi:hypothetical protein